VGAAAPPPTTEPDLSEIERSLAADAHETRLEEKPRASTPPTSAGGGSLAIQPDFALIGDFAFAAFSEDENRQTGAHDPIENGFNLQQLELSFGAAVDPYLRFDGNLVFSLFGVELEEAYGTTLDLPFRLQARFGQMLTRFGRANATHPHAWDFVDQPFALGRVFGAEGGRGLGVELSYLTPLPWYMELVFSATRADGESTARSFFGANDLGVDGPGDLLYVGAVKQFFPFGSDWSLLFGLSGAFGPNSTGRDNRTEVYAADFYLKYRPLARDRAGWIALQSEWFYRRRQVPEDVLWDVTGYAQGVYRFLERWSAAVRYEFGSPARGGHSETVVDPLDPEWVDSRTRISANVTHYPTEFSRFRLQGSRDAGFETPVWALFCAAELVIGAHGAHPF
jgi:hypothetical protein